MIFSVGLKENAGEVSLDLSADLAWSGAHTFLKPVVFSPQQRFSIEQLSSVDVSKGDLLFFGGDRWRRLVPGALGDVLVVAAGGTPGWGKLDLTTAASGVLDVQYGGTGLTKPLRNGLMLANNQSFMILPKGAPGEVLMSTAGGVAWSSLAVSGKGASQCFALWADDKTLIASPLRVDGESLMLGGTAPVFYFSDQQRNIFVRRSDQTLQFGAGETLLEVGGSGDSHALSVTSMSDFGPREVLRLGRDGALGGVTLNVDSLIGCLPTMQGGTGQFAYQPGDILYASYDGALRRLAIPQDSSLFLGVESGLPKWRAIPGMSGMSVEPGPMLPQPLKEQPVVGDMEFDGNALYFTLSSGQRKRLVFTDGSVTGSAGSVESVVPLQKGGTGSDLFGGATGSLLHLSTQTKAAWLDQGAKGQFLCSQGAGVNPIWATAITTLTGVSGVSVEPKGAAATLKIDTSSAFAPTWEGKHKFTKTAEFDQVQIAPSDMRRVAMRIAATPLVQAPPDGSLWYDGQRLMFQTPFGARSLSEEHDFKAPPVQHILALHNILPDVASYERRKVLVPYRAETPAIKTRWRLRRIDWLSENPPSGTAICEIHRNREPLTEAALRLEPGQTATWTADIMPVSLESGDVIEVYCQAHGESDLWSIHLLLCSED